MKKYLILPILLFTLFVSVNKVNADETPVYLSDFYDTYSFYSGIDNSVVSNLVSYYTTNLSANYQYYFIGYKNNVLTLTATNNNSFYYYSASSGFYNSSGTSSYSYNFTTQSYNTYDSTGTSYWNQLLFLTSTDFIFKDHTNCSANISSNCADIIELPLYSNLDLGVSFPQYTIKKDYVIPTYKSLSNNSYVNGPVGSSGSSGLVISDLFSNPIQALESVWQSIVNIFNLIGEFIALIPSPLKEFLISAFMLAIILGILKILL